MKTLSITSFVILALAGSLIASPQSSKPQFWGGKNSWQAKRHAQKMGLVAKGGAPIVFIGDSITHNWERDTKGRKQWNKYFAKGRCKAINLGYSADRTEHVLWRLQNGELDGYTAKCVLLMIGTNNTGHNPIEKEPPEDTVAGIKNILDLIRQKQPGAIIVLSAIFPRGEFADDPNRLRNDEVNRRIRKFTDGRKIFWCDMSDRFLKADGTLPKAVFPDFLHPVAPGYEIWHECVQPYIDYALSGCKGNPPPEMVSKHPVAKNIELAKKKRKLAVRKHAVKAKQSNIKKQPPPKDKVHVHKGAVAPLKKKAK